MSNRQIYTQQAMRNLRHANLPNWRGACNGYFAHINQQETNKMTTAEFIKKYGELITITTDGTPILPSVKMAQAILESGAGSSSRMMNANAMFGIKGVGLESPYWKGKVYNSDTREVINGTSVTVNSNFRAYDTLSKGVRDHTYLLMNLDRYKPVREAKTAEEQARALQTAGYATGENYANTLIKIIDDNNLKSLDQKKKIMKWIEISLAGVSIALAGWVIYKQLK